MQIQPYLFFNGRCEEALAFYKKALGAEVIMLMRYKESPHSPPPEMLPPGNEDKVMHASVRIGAAEFMASDGHCDGKPVFKGFSLSLTQPDEAKANRAFAALAEKGKVDMPLGKTFWSPCFGMVTDRFGMQWMITLPASEPS
ncbi:MAG: VOC family protein [Stenotrophobium sp.]